MLCPISEEIENDYEQDVESELAQASAQLKEAVAELPELVESEDECESVGDELDANGEMERPLDAPVRMPEVPVQRFSPEIMVRAKALGSRLPPYFLLDMMSHEEGKNRLQEVDIIHYEYPGRQRSGVKLIVLCADRKTGYVRIKHVCNTAAIENAFSNIVMEAGWHKLPDRVVHVVSDGESALLSELQASCSRMGLVHSPLPSESPNAQVAGSHITRRLREMVRGYLADAAQQGVAIDASFEALAWNYAVEVWNRLSSASHPQGHSPWQVHHGVRPIFTLAPFGCPGYLAITSKSSRSAHVRREALGEEVGGATRGEPVLFVGKRSIFSDEALVLTKRRTLRSGRSLWLDVDAPLGVFPGDEPVARSPRSSVAPVEVPPSTDSGPPVDAAERRRRRRAAKKQAVDQRIEQLEARQARVQGAAELQRSAARMMTAHDDSFRIRHLARPCTTPYIASRCRSVDGKTIAEALGMQFPDAHGALRRYRRSDLVYDIECKRLAVEYVGDPEAQSVAEVAWMSCLHATAEVSACSEVYLADVADQVAQMTHAHGVISMVDLPWKDYLHGPYAEAVQESFMAEERALIEKTGSLRELVEGTAEYAAAKKASTQMRPLLNRKRDGTWKTRWVMRGDLEDKILLDGPGFDYFASVSRMSTVRLTVLRSGRHVPRPHRPGVRVLSTRDVDTAFLQSDPFPETDVRYVRIRSPIDGQMRYYRQYKPIYGSCSAPVRWQKTFVNWLTRPESEGGAGLVRGHNEPCVFHHPGRDLVLVLYVDDLMVDGYREDHEWLYALMDKSFSCKAPQYLTEETPINHLGVDIFMTKDVIGMSMRTYISQMQVVLGMQDAKPQSVPLVGNIEDREPLPQKYHRWFSRALGMCGWLSSTTRIDGRLAHSRISQYAKSPTIGAYEALRGLVRYYIGTADHAICQSLHHDVGWSAYSDADLGGNPEPQNKRRSQYGYVVLLGDAPVVWGSKASSVSFGAEYGYPAGYSKMEPVTAHPLLKDEHADISSAAAEIYAAATAVNDILMMQYVCEEMGIGFQLPFILQVDNQAACCFASQEQYSGKSKLRHIDQRQAWVKSLRDSNIIKTQFVPTLDNRADWLTKPLAQPAFVRFREMMMKRCSF